MRPRNIAAIVVLTAALVGTISHFYGSKAGYNYGINDASHLAVAAQLQRDAKAYQQFNRAMTTVVELNTDQALYLWSLNIELDSAALTLIADDNERRYWLLDDRQANEESAFESIDQALRSLRDARQQYPRKYESATTLKVQGLELPQVAAIVDQALDQLAQDPQPQ